MEMGIYRRYYFHRNWTGIKSVYLSAQSFPKSLHSWHQPRYRYDDYFPICGCRNSIYYQSFPEEKGTSEDVERITENRISPDLISPILVQLKSKLLPILSGFENLTVLNTIVAMDLQIPYAEHIAKCDNLEMGADNAKSN